MSHKMKLLLFGIGACFIICVCGVLLVFVLTQQPPTKTVVYTVPETDSDFVLAEPGPQKPSLDEFLEEYVPTIADASPEVRAVMKEFDPRFRTNNRDPVIENFLPADEWFQKLLDMGIVIDDYSDYSGWLSERYILLHAHKDPQELASIKDLLNLDADASWEEVVEADIRKTEKLYRLVNQAQAADPLISGGSLSSRGVFIPNRENTIYVRTEGTKTDLNFGSGVPDWVAKELAHRHSGMPPERQIPKHIDVIFLSDNGQPVSQEVAQSRAIVYQLEPYLIKGAEPENEPDTNSVSIDRTINDGDNNYEFETADEAIRARPDPNMSIEELIDSAEIDLDADFTPKLPTDMPTESEVEQGLNDVERRLREPESEDHLRRLKQIDGDATNEKEPEQHSTPVKAD